MIINENKDLSEYNVKLVGSIEVKESHKKEKLEEEKDFIKSIKKDLELLALLGYSFLTKEEKKDKIYIKNNEISGNEPVGFISKSKDGKSFIYINDKLYNIKTNFKKEFNENEFEYFKVEYNSSDELVKKEKIKIYGFKHELEDSVRIFLKDEINNFKNIIISISEEGITFNSVIKGEVIEFELLMNNDDISLIQLENGKVMKKYKYNELECVYKIVDKETFEEREEKKLRRDFPLDKIIEENKEELQEIVKIVNYLDSKLSEKTSIINKIFEKYSISKNEELNKLLKGINKKKVK